MYGCHRVRESIENLTLLGLSTCRCRCHEQPGDSSKRTIRQNKNKYGWSTEIDISLVYSVGIIGLRIEVDLYGELLRVNFIINGTTERLLTSGGLRIRVYHLINVVARFSLLITNNINSVSFRVCKR